MRVVHIIKAVGIAGAERHLLILFAGLVSRGVDVRLLLLVEPDKPLDDYVSQMEALGVHVQRVVIQKGLDRQIIPTLRQHLRTLKPELVHTHLVHADTFGSLAAKWAGVKIVITSRHNEDDFRHRSPFKIANRILWRNFNAVIAISEATNLFTRQVEQVPPEKITTIRYGLPRPTTQVDHEGAARSLRQQFNLPENSPVVGMIGRLISQKGMSYGLQGFASISLRFPDARLLIVGDGVLRQDLEAEARKLGIHKQVVFAGWRTDVPQLMAGLDIFLMPSLWEGFGLVLLEAMAAAVPSIASQVSAIPEIIVDGETGLLVEPESAPAIANALTTLLSDPILRRHMGMLALERLETHFDAERMVDATYQLYQQLLGSAS